MRVSDYFTKIVTDYFRQGKLIYYTTDDGVKEYATCFVDDITIVVVAKLLEKVVQISNHTIRIVRHWLASVGIKLAGNKTEMVLTSSRKKKSMTLMVGGNENISKRAIKYLGVMIYSRLHFREHLKYVSKKASLIIILMHLHKLCQIMEDQGIGEDCIIPRRKDKVYVP